MIDNGTHKHAHLGLYARGTNLYLLITHIARHQIFKGQKQIGLPRGVRRPRDRQLTRISVIGNRGSIGKRTGRRGKRGNTGNNRDHTAHGAHSVFANRKSHAYAPHAAAPARHP